MKKIFSILLIVSICMLSTVGCTPKRNNEEQSSQTAAETEKETEIAIEETDFEATCVKKKAKRYVIVLPISGHIILVDNSYSKYLANVSDAMVLAAEEKITEAIKGLEKEPYWTIEINDNDQLCLRVEVIKYIDNEDPDAVGCGIDHEHLVFLEPITVQ